MAIPSRGIGWGTEENLLWEISKQLQQLTNVTAKACTNCTTTTSTTTLPTYQVFTALLTQSGSSNPVYIVSGDSIFKGITYQIVQNLPNADLTIYGAPNNEVGTFFICTETAQLPNTTGINLLYDTGAPVATILENTIGYVWFTYDDVGSYLASGDFPINRTYAVISNMGQIPADNILITSYIVQDALYLITNSVSSSGASANSDNILLTTPIEIRVYN